MSDYSWDDDLFEDDDFLDDSFDDLGEEEPVKKKAEKTKKAKPAKKEKPVKKEKSGGLFKKKATTKPAPAIESSDDEDDDFDADEIESDNTSASSDDFDEYNEDDGIDSDDDFEDDDEEVEVKKPASKKDNKKKPREHVHGLKKKSGNGKAKGAAGKVATVIAVVAAVGIAGGLSFAVTNGQITELKQANSNLTTQIANQTMNVYTAKKDIAKGDEIIVSGDMANVEISQVYTSLPESSYINDATTGYAQVDIKAGEPVMVSEIGATNPVSELNDAIASIKAEYNKAKEMPYKISADFIDLNTGNTLAESRDLTLDPGANEKAFNTEAETIDGYVLKSIQVDKEGVHAYGVSEKSMKEGIVTMYYYTTKAGWGRHEIKGNIRVTFGYVKKDDPSLEEEGVSDVMDDSAWIVTEDTTANASEDALAAVSDEQSEENTTTESDTAETVEEKAENTAKTEATATTKTAAKTTTAANTTTQKGATASTATDTSTAAASNISQEADSSDNEGPSVDTETIDIDDVN